MSRGLQWNCTRTHIHKWISSNNEMFIQGRWNHFGCVKLVHPKIYIYTIARILGFKVRYINPDSVATGASIRVGLLLDFTVILDAPLFCVPTFHPSLFGPMYPTHRFIINKFHYDRTAISTYPISQFIMTSSLENEHVSNSVHVLWYAAQINELRRLTIRNITLYGCRK